MLLKRKLTSNGLTGLPSSRLQVDTLKIGRKGRKLVEIRILVTLVCLSMMVLSIEGQTAYHPQVSQVLMCYADRAYCTLNQLATRQCSQRCSLYNIYNLTIFSNNQERLGGFVGYSPFLQAIIISIRGTNSVINWNENIKIKLANYYGCAGCSVHQGWLHNWIKIRQDVWSAYNWVAATWPASMVYMTGHSMGAAVSVIAGYEFQQKYGFLPIIYNYGCPRIGNPAFAKVIDQTFKGIYYRVINYGDLAARYPASISGYVHSGTEVWLVSRTAPQYKICPSPGNGKQANNCANSLSALKISPWDHDQYEYFMRLMDPSKVQSMKRRPRPDRPKWSNNK